LFDTSKTAKTINSLVRYVIFAIFVAKIDCYWLFDLAGAQISQKYWGSIFPTLDPILCHHFQNGWLQVEYATY